MGREGDNGGWDGWMASLTQWTWIWVNSRSWWWTGKPWMLQLMGSQRVRHDWATELNWWANIQKTPRYICFSWDHKNSQFSWDSQCLHRLPFHPPKHSMYAFLNLSLSLGMYWSLEKKGGITRQISIFLFLPFLSMQILKTFFPISPLLKACKIIRLEDIYIYHLLIVKYHN